MISETFGQAFSSGRGLLGKGFQLRAAAGKGAGFSCAVSGGVSLSPAAREGAGFSAVVGRDAGLLPAAREGAGFSCAVSGGVSLSPAANGDTSLSPAAGGAFRLGAALGAGGPFRRALPLLLGYALVLLFALGPVVLLGQDMSLPLLDWLDGDITGKVLLGRNLKSFSDYFAPQVPQMMRGAAMWSNTPSTLLYAWLSPFAAYAVECFLTVTAAYWGMVLFLRRAFALVTRSASASSSAQDSALGSSVMQDSTSANSATQDSASADSAVQNTTSADSAAHDITSASTAVQDTASSATAARPRAAACISCVSAGARTVISAAAAVLFACLPFYTVHDLTTMGIPLVLWAFVVLWQAGQAAKPSRALTAAAYGAVVVFGACSTLAFSGYFIVGFLALFLLVQTVRRRFAGLGRLSLAFVLLCALYGVANLGLVQSLFGLGGSDFVSHRTIYAPGTLASGEVFSEFKTMLLHGQYHAGSKHFAALACAVLILAAFALFWKRLDNAQRRVWLFCAGLLCCGVLIAAFYAFCGTAAYARFVALLGPAVSSFQFDRLYFLYPTLWYTLLAGAVLLVLSAGPALVRAAVDRFAASAQGAARLPRALPRAAAALVLAACFAFVLRGNYLTDNWRAVFTGQQPASAVTWRQFFAEDLFADVRASLAQSTPDGEPVVVSLGLSPAISLYNGFSTLDGYSNNYALSYHEQFGRVLRGEIKKDAALAAYFYDWGNRCYLFTPQLGSDFSYRRSTADTPPAPLANLAFDWQALRAMGGTHVLSFLPLADCAQYGLTDCGKFAGDAYDLYVYAL